MNPFTWAAFFPAAIALALERLCYFGVWRHPQAFEALCRRWPFSILGEPVAALQRLFYGFKAIQALVFFVWIGGHSGWFADGPRSFVTPEPLALGLGCLMIAAGQSLNFLVFRRLGRAGVFYGSRFGYDVPWVHGFPFSILDHPQYVGTVATIWGLLLATRFPHDDWIWLPLLETAYYILGARLERDRPGLPFRPSSPTPAASPVSLSSGAGAASAASPVSPPVSTNGGESRGAAVPGRASRSRDRSARHGAGGTAPSSRCERR